MGKKSSDSRQLSLFDDWLVDATPAAPQTIMEPIAEPEQPVVAATSEQSPTIDESRYHLAIGLAAKLNDEGEITNAFLTHTANRVFGGTQSEGTYSPKDAYDAMEAGFNLHLLATETANWIDNGAVWAQVKAAELTQRIQRLPTQTRRDPEMDEFQQFSTPPALSFVANWVANVQPSDRMMEPSAGTGDLAIWSRIAGADIVLNELSPRRHALLAQLFPYATLFCENAEQLDNVLPADTVPSVIVMNPPFSSTAGRVQGQRSNANGARHIEQALRRLDDGGRLVAIVGKGMGYDRPAFRSWWREIETQYNVRANIGIAGREYAKYGTNFDNQILVIDKNGPTTQPVLTGQVATVAELPALLEGIRNDRKHLQREPVESTSNEDTVAIQDSIRPEPGIGDSGTDSRGARTESIGNADDFRTAATNSEVGGESVTGHELVDGIRTRSDVRDNVTGEPGGSGGDDLGGASRFVEGSGTGIAVEATATVAGEFTDSIFARYTPQRLSIPDAHAHPGKLVQSAAMSAVEPLAPTYTPALPARVVRQGLLSIAQLESIVYAGQAHSEVLPNGSRKGFFIGDGTGVGKGREISGIILDNFAQGRKKAVWVSFNEGLINDARRDYSSIGGNSDSIFFQGKTKAGNELTQTDGILFTTYSTLRGGEKKQATDLGQKGGKSRLQQMVEWLGKDFDGVIAFDEAHSMGNAIAIKGKRGVRKPSQQAIAGINLQRELPNARIVYVSATGATEVSNLSYADRLGLWGEGTPFADANAFINGVSAGGIASMELISRDMKAMGMYLARSLSYDGVSYERMEHTLSELQEDIYNELAGAWQIVLNNVEKALEITQAGKSGPGKSAALAQFWGAHQRFFNQIITAMQTPAVIDHIQQQLDAGHAAVIQIVNTNEAAQERIIADAMANDTDLEDLDFTPRQMLMDYVRNGFPVAAFEETRDDNGNTIYVPIKDAGGNQVFDREAIALREQLLNNLQHIRVPENPLDSIINAFGSDTVAEITGRGRRFVQVRDDEGNLMVVEEKRGKNSSRVDAELFQADKKKILIFSGAGGTGYSFHADNTAANTRKRIHYILQPGWRADAAVQGFGRTHRTNQATEPHYVLPTTNLKAQKRFVSSIARRLDQLGALTRGQRQATSQGMFTAADNLESEYAKSALNTFFVDLYHNRTGLSFQNVTREMGLNLLDRDGAFDQSKIPDIPQFLNRLLSLKTDQQNAVFDEFESRLIEAVEYAKQHGLYDEGLQTLRALNIQKTRDEVAYEDAKTGAQTRYVELAVTNELHYVEWDEIAAIAKRQQQRPGMLSGWFVHEHGRNKGNVFFMDDRGERMNSEGDQVRRGVIHGIKKHGHRYIDNAEVIHRGWEYRFVKGSSTKVTLTRQIDETEAERLWKAQIEAAPKTETNTTSMLVGVILPIWDRVEGSETIYRLQTDDGEQLLGRLLGQEAAKQTLKNLGLDSATAKLSPAELFAAIQAGQRAVLSNGWEISLATVNREQRIEVKGRLSDAEKRVLTQQGAFVERINWQERVFIPTGDVRLPVFERITASKPVVDLFQRGRGNDIQVSRPFSPGKANTALPTIQSDEPKIDVARSTPLPDGWTEAEPNGLIANPDPIKGGIIDNEAVSGKWFAIPNNDAIPQINNLNTREDALAALTREIEQVTNQKENNPMDDKTEKKSFAQVVADNLVTQLKQGTAPWQRRWESAPAGSIFPVNPITGKRYRGINAIHLLSQNYLDQRWMTYKQAESIGAQVRKGEKGTSIQYWKYSEEQDMLDDQGRPLLDANGQKIKETIQLERPRMFLATVFNGEQIDGLPPQQIKPMVEQQWDVIERAEHILKASGANIMHMAGDRAFYRPSTDSITLPEKNQFKSTDRYYAVALHELGHWTGHPSRLNRDLTHPYGSEGYAKEELRAEISSMIVGNELGIGHDPEQHAAYVGSWIKVLQDDPLEIFRASSDAEKIYDYVLAFEHKLVHEHKQDKLEASMNPKTNELAAALLAAHPIEKIQGIGLAAVARRQLISGEIGSQAFAAATRQYLGVELPPDWNGELRIVGVAEHDGQIVDADQFNIKPQAFQVYARKTDVQFGEDAFAVVFSAHTKDQSEVFAESLYLVDALGTDNQYMRGAKLARIHEERVRRDFNSTDEDISAAKEARKDAEITAMLNDQDLQNRIVEHEQQEQAQAQAVPTVSPVGARDAQQDIRDYKNAATEYGQLYLHNHISQLSKAFPEYMDEVRRSAPEIAAEIDEQRQFLRQLRDERMARLAEMHEVIGDEQSQPGQQPKHQPAQAKTTQGAERQYINVPFKEKDEAKGLGARWDRQQQSWYVPAGVDTALFVKWAQSTATAVPDAGLEAIAPHVQAHAKGEEAAQGRTYLAVPYAERGAAKAAGALWDKAAKSWYAGPRAHMVNLEHWNPENISAQQGPAMTPREEFAQAMRSAGLFVGQRPDGNHPIMDGKKHRVPVDGGKPGSLDGFYVGHLDGHPAGRIINNKTGTDITWKSKGYALSDEDKAKLQAEAATKLAERAAEQERQQEDTAQRLGRQMASLMPIEQLTPYLEAKGIKPHAGALTNKDGQETYIPAFDADGKLWTMQYIQEDGTKRYAKNSKKEGCFHPVGGMDALAVAPVLLISEGYATAVQVSEAVGHATVAAFDSGNLEAVTKALHEKFPDKPVVIAGDDDRHLVMTHGNNPGREKAEAAAKAVGGKAIFPIFAPADNTYPRDLPAITPDSYKTHLRAEQSLADAATGKVELTDVGVAKLKASMLSDAQIASLSTMKQHTDFNDLAHKSELGHEGVKRQINAAVGKVLIDVGLPEKVQKFDQGQNQVQKQEQRPRRVARIG